MSLVIVLVCAFLINASLGQDTPQQESRVVTTAQGPVRGYKASNYDVFQFYNIPYATAPTGLDKFKAPLPPPMWLFPFDAVDRKIVCPQDSNNPLIANMNRQEDCLVTNIHVPNTNETNLPVLVLVHGGALMLGWGSMEIPNGLVSSKNIIVVTFNYRLGAHGFLCLGTEDAPGNAGMKDQVALLRWVQTNIRNFGGNPDDVTISGCSAGGTSTDFLLLSNMTNGLFNKVIVESACSTNTYSVQLDPLRNARHIAQNLGFTNGSDLNALAAFYQTIPILDLFDNLLLLAKDSYFFFAPCIEKDIGQQIFLEDAPVNILKSGNFKKLPVIYGYARQEGLFRIPLFESDAIAMNENFTEYLPADLQFETEAEKIEVANTVKQFYFGNNLVNENTVLEFVDFFTDVLFLRGILRSINLRVKAGHNEVYLYEYSFTHNGSIIIPHTDRHGATHCDQFGVLLDHSAPESLSEERIEMGRTMRDIVYNFMATGNPTPPGSDSSLPTWPPAGPDRSPHYSVGATIEVAGIPTEDRAKFWDDIYERYGATPQPPIEIVEGETTTPTAESESTTLETTETTVLVTETEELTSPDEDEQTTTPEPNAATSNIFSFRFWIVYAVVILIAVKLNSV